MMTFHSGRDGRPDHLAGLKGEEIIVAPLSGRWPRMRIVLDESGISISSMARPSSIPTPTVRVEFEAARDADGYPLHGDQLPHGPGHT